MRTLIREYNRETGLQDFRLANSPRFGTRLRIGERVEPEAGDRVLVYVGLELSEWEKVQDGLSRYGLALDGTAKSAGNTVKVVAI
jgi:hypothetical protein